MKRNFKFDEIKKKKLKQNWVAEGEVTGHFHRIKENAEVFKSVDDECLLLRVLEPTKITHEEHDALDLYSGNFKINIKREYDHFEEETRRVID